MQRILELQNAANFSLQYSNSIPPTGIELINGKTIYAKLTEVFVPAIFDKNIILVLISTTVPIGKIWRFAGRVSRIVSTGLGDSFLDDKKSLFLGKGNLVIFSEVEADYTISILPPPWFISLNIAVYQYEGVDNSSLNIDLNRIENKIDALASP